MANPTQNGAKCPKTRWLTPVFWQKTANPQTTDDNPLNPFNPWLVP
jgi:hypothetical protein